MMKKLCFVLLLAVLLLAVGCEKPEPAEPAAPTQNHIRVGFSQVGAESSWRVANTQSMTEAFSEENGFELLMDNAKQRQENQLLAIRNFIQQEVDYIVLAPISEIGWDDVLSEARDAGIPVIIVDRQIRVEDDSLYTCWVGSDFYAEGHKAIDWLEQQFSPDEEVRILHIQGTDLATPQLLRTRALTDAVEAHENWSILADLKGEYTEAKGYEVVRDYLKTSRDIDVIYSENDNMTFGAMRALDEAAVTYGVGGQVTILSFDAVHDALVCCLNGEINLCVECNPLHGPRVADIIRQLEEGQTPPKKSFVDETSFAAGSVTPEIIAQRQY